MKIMTVMGTRPEYIRLSKIIAKLDKACDKHILVETGQSYDWNMAGVFTTELGIRGPDQFMAAKADSPEKFISNVGIWMERNIPHDKPDKILLLGDTNSVRPAAEVAKILGVKVYHMEAGNRCYSDTVREEVNRRVIDACSDVLLPYTQNAKQNLLAEGYSPSRILVTGNPIYEVTKNIPDNGIFKELNLNAPMRERILEHIKSGGDRVKNYFLVTFHRHENVENDDRLRAGMASLKALAKQYPDWPIIFSEHPRTAARIKELGIDMGGITFHEPFGLFDFVNLERYADCVLTDSGTVQEECCIFGVPCVTLRDQTERPETLECGSNILAGVEPENVLRAVKIVLASEPKWTPPSEYTDSNVSEKVVRILTGF